MMKDHEVVEKKVRGRAFFKKCPNCGKRFEVERTGESVEKAEELVPVEQAVIPQTIVNGAAPIAVANTVANQPPVVKNRTLVEEDQYTDSYKCKHCGYVWTEMHEKIKDLGQLEGIGPDL